MIPVRVFRLLYLLMGRVFGWLVSLGRSWQCLAVG
jgi:hypothetical protein